MIKLNQASFIYTSEDTQTSSKVSELVVNYTNYLGTKEIDGVSTPQGYIQSFVYTETMNSIMNDVQEDTNFSGNILGDLHDMYINRLEILNPSLTFVSTL